MKAITVCHVVHWGSHNVIDWTVCRAWHLCAAHKIVLENTHVLRQMSMPSSPMYSQTQTHMTRLPSCKLHYIDDAQNTFSSVKPTQSAAVPLLAYQANRELDQRLVMDWQSTDGRNLLGDVKRKRKISHRT